MFEVLQERWERKQIAQTIIAILILVLLALLFFIQAGGLSSGRVTRGIVLSTGSISVSGVCGGTREMASVRLSDGHVVIALVTGISDIRAGSAVVLRQQLSSCNPTGYQLVAMRRPT